MRRFSLGRASLFAVLCFPIPSTPQASSSTAEVARAGLNGVTIPACVYCPDPSYTKKARAAKFEGTVQIIVTADGRAEDVKVTKGTGKDLGLEQNAIDAVRKWRFKPAHGPDGKPIAALVPVEVTFLLH